MIQKQLLCTFTESSRYLKVISDIKETYELADKRLFVFQNEKNIKEIFLTFNIFKDKLIKTKYANTISVHRKKHTNTIYTLNAMNRLIEDENDGIFDKSYQLNWELYKNSIILITDIGVKIVPIKLSSIVSA